MQCDKGIGKYKQKLLSMFTLYNFKMKIKHRCVIFEQLVEPSNVRNSKVSAHNVTQVPEIKAIYFCRQQQNSF
jgi:hypothetical protein